MWAGMPSEERLELEIRGELAGILQLCETSQKTKPGTVSGAGLIQQFKMVAGTRKLRESLIVPIEL
jgi:hypothetical protein